MINKKHSTFILIAILLLFAPILAQQQLRQEKIALSEEDEAIFQNKKERILQEITDSINEEWAGIYRASDSATVTTYLFWKPVNGFAIYRDNCSRIGIEQANYGNVSFDGNILKFKPEVTEQSRTTYKMPAEFTPIKWGEQHWLIPTNEIILFCYAVNSKSIEETEKFLVKVEDYEKSNDGLPNVPKQFQKYLGLKPITTIISKVGNEEADWFPTITLRAGKNKGVIEGMKFYLINHKTVLLTLEIEKVYEQTSEARVISAGRSDDYEKEIKPEIGWKFSSRLPEGY